ncbi:TlpA disulfide reductase family protein [uncultured Alistipes sp.]|uniref:TlpA family protein disulfide reductase n=1 Tax=uncultured Alistipes sp. TaxID=538949 RepID=UPI0025E5CCC4|nr:TlpA disulfide reductase family protein [uncultured Alistipes sp.]
MKKLLFAAVAFIFSANCAMAQIPNVKVENGKGEMISASSLVDGKTPLVISFWSTTCKPCIRELNTINDQLEDWKEEVDFRVIAVSTDDSRSASKAKAMAAGNGWEDFMVLYDKNQELKRAMNVNLTPQIFVTDGNGKIVYSHTGYSQGSEMEVLKTLKKLKK